jgi:hypothetical protein
MNSGAESHCYPPRSVYPPGTPCTHRNWRPGTRCSRRTGSPHMSVHAPRAGDQPGTPLRAPTLPPLPESMHPPWVIASVAAHLARAGLFWGASRPKQRGESAPHHGMGHGRATSHEPRATHFGSCMLQIAHSRHDADHMPLLSLLTEILIQPSPTTSFCLSVMSVSEDNVLSDNISVSQSSYGCT